MKDAELELGAFAVWLESKMEEKKRTNKNWSNGELARKLKVQRNLIGKWLKGTVKKPNYKNLYELSNIFGEDFNVLKEIVYGKVELPSEENIEVSKDRIALNSFRNLQMSVGKNIFGRNEQLAEIKKYIKDEVPLSFVVGISGVGKSTLVKIVYNSESLSFDQTIFCFCNGDFSVDDIDESMKAKLEGANLHNVNERILNRLQQNRCLLILDDLNLESSKHQESYRHLLHRIAEIPHQSCVIVTSKTSPSYSRSWEPRPKFMRLEGIDEAAAIQLLNSEGLSPQKNSNLVKALVKKYGGNPWLLKLAVQDVVELYQKNLNEYFKHSTVFVKEFSKEIESIVERLSALEMEILYWLALHRESFDINEIREAFPDRYKSALNGNHIRDSVLELDRRSLLQKHEGEFSLLSVVQDYVSIKLFREICLEIEALSNSRFEGVVWLRKLQLQKEQIKLRDRLIRDFSQKKLFQALRQLESLSKESSAELIGYALENLWYFLEKSENK